MHHQLKSAVEIEGSLWTGKKGSHWSEYPFLEMFYLFGYAFIINNLNAHKLLDAIHNPDSAIPIGIVKSKEISKHSGLSIIREPESLSNYLLTLPLFYNGKQENVSLIIPGHGEKAWGNYENYFKTSGGTFHMEGINNWRGIVDDQENLFQYFLLLGQQIPRYGLKDEPATEVS